MPEQLHMFAARLATYVSYDSTTAKVPKTYMIAWADLRVVTSCLLVITLRNIDC
jgi:hypothetical protein